MSEKSEQADRSVRNVLLFLIDSLRFDTLSDLKAAKKLFPNLAGLVEQGMVRRLITNGPATQVVMPAVFSLTYPLDHGGYNTGIRERPRSFVECLQSAGIETRMASACNQMGRTHGYGRGFAVEQTAIDFRHILEYLIDKNLNYELALLRRKEKDAASVTAVIQRELSLVLTRIIEDIEDYDQGLWSPALTRINNGVAAGAKLELALVEQEPDIVVEKLRRIPPLLYCRYLGVREPGRFKLFLSRAIESFRWRTRKFIAKRNFPFLLLTHFQTIAGDVLPQIADELQENRYHSPWYIHSHVMDLHDCRAVNRIGQRLFRLRFLPRWLSARARGLTARRFTYDSALMYVDHHLGGVVDALRRTGQLSNTTIVVTGDHALHYAESPRTKPHLGTRMHYEDIEVPLVVSPFSKTAVSGLIDSKDIAATVLDLFDVPLDPSFKGETARSCSRRFVVTENAGSGNADLSRKDLYFAVTTERYRMIAVLEGPDLRPLEFFDLDADPKETRNRVQEPTCRPIVDGLLDDLIAERRDIFTARGYPVVTS